MAVSREYANRDNIVAFWNKIKLNFVQAAPCAKGAMLYWDDGSTKADPKQPSRLTIPEEGDLTKAVLGINNTTKVPEWRFLETSLAWSGTTAPSLNMSVYGQQSNVTLPMATPVKAGLMSTTEQSFAGRKTFQDDVVIGSSTQRAILRFYNNNPTRQIRHILGYTSVDGTNDLLIGYDVPTDSGKTRIYGHSIEFMHSTTRTVGMILGSDGVLTVDKSIESTGGGVAARGIATLAMGGGAGSGGDVVAVQIGTDDPVYADVNGIVKLNAYPSLEGYATVGYVSLNYATGARVQAIEDKIPSQASSTNQLADKAFVNSSIATNTATFRGTSAAGLNETQFLAWANGLPHDINDYVFWQTTDGDNTVYKRYKYNGSNWIYEYSLNNSSFTSQQWAAINSGATTTIISNIIPKTIGTAKGDIITFSAQNTPARLGIGAAGQFLGVGDGSPKWQTFSNPSVVWSKSAQGVKINLTVQGKSSGDVDLPKATGLLSGIVTADTGSPQTFAGDKIFNNGLTLGQLQALRVTNSNTSDTYDVLSQTSNNILRLGYATAAAGFTTWICGNEIRFRYGVGNNLGFILANNGNIGMGISNPSSKLHVIGTTTLQTVIPHSTDSYDIGSSSGYWRDIYLNSLKAATTLSMYIGSNQKAALTATGLAVFGGVSANGIDSLAVGGGGGTGTATSVQVGEGTTPYPADANGVIKIPAYPSLEGYAKTSDINLVYATKTALNAVTVKIPTAASASNQLADKQFVSDTYATKTYVNGTFQPLSGRVNAITGASTTDYPSTKAVWDFASLQHGKSGSGSLDPIDFHVIKIGDKTLYLRFNTAVKGTFALEVATGLNNEDKQEFVFSTISEAEINSICVL